MKDFVYSIRWIVVLAAVLTGVLPALAAPLAVTGDERHLWVLTPGSNAGTNTIHHRRLGDPPNTLAPVRSEVGKVLLGGLATADNKLWLVYDSLLVQSLELTASELPIKTYRTKVEPALPKGSQVIALAAGARGPWALVRVTQEGVLRAIDAPPAESASGTADSDKSAAAPPPQADQNPVNEVRLLRMGTTSWLKAELPADWPGGAVGWLVFTDPAGAHPVLLALPETGAAAETGTSDSDLWVYRFAVQPVPTPATQPADDTAQRSADQGAGGQPPTAPPPGVTQRPVQRGPTTRPAPASPALPKGQWVRQDYRLPPGGAILPVTVDRQLVVARRDPAQPTLTVRAWVLRPEGMTELATMALDVDPDAVPWNVAPVNQTLGLIAATDTRKWLWTRNDLMGHQVIAPVEVTEPSPVEWRQQIGMVVLIMVLVAATLILFLFWKREPAGVVVKLPADLAVADLGTRALAGLIDLAPCLAIAMFVFKVSIMEVFTVWPAFPGGATHFWPELTAIGLFVLHTTLSEMFTGQTLGKRIMGLHVTDLSGNPINIWQALGRGLTKALDLVPPFPLLLFPLFNPSRQRLGDLMAKTLVVGPAPEKDEPEESQDDGFDDVE
ncbi:MAG: RDD family protein [Phycisphaeraceae bacterium]